VAKLFDLDRLSKSPAIFDTDKCMWVNGQHLRQLSGKVLVEKIEPFIPAQHLFFQQTQEWKEKCLELFKTQIQFFQEISPLLDDIFSTKFELIQECVDIYKSDAGKVIFDYVREEVDKKQETYFSDDQWDEWSSYLKNQKQLKGKILFMGLRSVITGKVHGPELKFLLPLIPVTVLKERLQHLKQWYQP
jgi:nondiscriminating glutamyl-tRNA synthetase